MSIVPRENKLQPAGHNIPHERVIHAQPSLTQTASAPRDTSITDLTARFADLEEKFSELEDRVAAIDPMFPEYMSTGEAAAYLSVSDWTIREMAKDQIIAYSKLHSGSKAPFIFERHDLDNYIAERRIEKHVTPEIRT